jgi:hypothetical protein
VFATANGSVIPARQRPSVGTDASRIIDLAPTGRIDVERVQPNRSLKTAAIILGLLLAAALMTVAQETPPAPTPTPLPAETPPDDDLLLVGEDESSDLLDEADLLSGDWPDDEAIEPEKSESVKAHERLFLETRYPSANTCATCHPKHYREWSVSQHAYAQLSPLMMSMQNAVNVAVSTSAGDFCLRCHAPIGAELAEPFSMSNLDRHPASREGITCVACHRMSQAWGKVSGRLAFEEGDIFSPIYGPTGAEELERVRTPSGSSP